MPRTWINRVVGFGVLFLMLGAFGGVGSTFGGQVWTVAEEMASEKKAPRVLIKTKFGEMKIVLFPDLAPKHVASFLKLTKSGFYNGTVFHRVIPEFMIQGGDLISKDPSKRRAYGTGSAGFTLPAEFSKISHERGILSAARQGGDINSASSQFFIVVKKSTFLDRQYTVFGEVVKGMEVADKIVKQPRDSRDNPLDRIEITVEVIE